MVDSRVPSVFHENGKTEALLMLITAIDTEEQEQKNVKKSKPPMIYICIVLSLKVKGGQP